MSGKKLIATSTDSERQSLRPSDVLDGLQGLWLTKKNKRDDSQMATVLEAYLRSLADIPPWALVAAIRDLQKSGEWFPSDAEIRHDAVYLLPDKQTYLPAPERQPPPKKERAKVSAEFKSALEALRGPPETMDERRKRLCPQPRYLTSEQLKEARAEAANHLQNT